MIRKRMSWSVVGLLLLMLVLIACTPQTVEVTRVVQATSEAGEPVEVEVEVTRVVEQEVEVEVPVEVTRVIEVEVEGEEAALGSEERPIKVLFVPSVEADTIVAGGEVLAAALNEATGLTFEVSVPTSYAATIEEMCASPEDTIGFIPAQGYVLANQRCGVTVGAAAIRNGLPWYAAQFVVAADSEFETLEDLEGATWAIPDFGSTSGYLYPQAALEQAGVNIPEENIIEAGGHPNAMLAVYNGEVDVATGFFSPPLLPEGVWTYGVHDPEIWREADVSPLRNEEGRVFVNGTPDEGGYRILDSRAGVTDTAPDIFDTTRILAITDQIPNDSVSFGPNFPLALADDIVDALVAFTATEQCAQSICGEEFYSWTGLAPVTDSFYDPVREAMEALGITEEDVLGG